MSPQSPLSMLSKASLAALVLATFVSARASDAFRPADPFADPANDVFNPLRYIASNSLSAVGVALTLAIALAQTFLSIKYKTKYMLAMTIAAYTYAVGIAIRFGLAKQPDSSGLYIAFYLFATLSPCGFIAAEYVLLGRLARSLDGDAHLLIRPQKVTLIFVSSDITTFLIQAVGGSITSAAHDDVKKNQAGTRIFLAGLAIQLVSFAFFTLLYLRFLYRVHKYEPQVWMRDAHKSWFRDWRSLAAALVVSCIGVLVRSVYRTIELAQGFNGFLSRHEVYFYTLDFVPLIVALVVYIPFWPGRFIDPAALAAKTSDAEKAGTSGSIEGVETLNEPVPAKEL
ncbi:RTA1-like protein [Trametopsis cervina]|nr:RTA1-like protein [Trametopsis cervina]